MQIAAVEARWLRAPIPAEKQHTSDFGRLRTFDAVLVTVRTKDGIMSRVKAHLDSVALALGLGIGVNAMAFTIYNAALFKALPFDNPSRVVHVDKTEKFVEAERTCRMTGYLAGSGSTPLWNRYQTNAIVPTAKIGRTHLAM